MSYFQSFPFVSYSERFQYGFCKGQIVRRGHFQGQKVEAVLYQRVSIFHLGDPRLSILLIYSGRRYLRIQKYYSVFEQLDSPKRP